MKAKVHMRVGLTPQGKPKVAATVKPNLKPLTSGYGEAPIPTAAFAMVLDVPDEMFRRAESVLAHVTVTDPPAQIAVELVEQAA